MSTSLADLLAALDEASRDPELTAGDSANALQHLSTSLRWANEQAANLRLAEVQARGIAQRAHDIAQTWPQELGRCTALAGVTADVLGLHAPGMNHADTAITTLAIVTVARRCAIAIDEQMAATGAQLQQFIQDCNAYRQRAVRKQTPTSRAEWLHRPFSYPEVELGRLTAPEQCSESLAAILDYLHMHGRHPLTARQILAVSRVGEVIATCLEELAEAPGSHQAGTWTAVRKQLQPLRDGHADPGQFGNARLMQAAAAADRAARLIRSDDLTSPHVQDVAGRLPGLAKRLSRDLVLARPWLLATPGEQPMHEQRTREWLTDMSFKIEARDLEVSLGLLRSLEEARPAPFASEQLLPRV